MIIGCVLAYTKEGTNADHHWKAWVWNCGADVCTLYMEESN